MGEFEWTIFEIFEMIISVSIFLLIGSAILLISDVNYVKAQSVGIETSYTTSLISGKNAKLILNYPNLEEINLDSNKNKVIIEIKGKEDYKIEKSYIGQKEIQISKQNNQITIISNE